MDFLPATVPRRTSKSRVGHRPIVQRFDETIAVHRGAMPYIHEQNTLFHARENRVSLNTR